MTTNRGRNMIIVIEEIWNLSQLTSGCHHSRNQPKNISLTAGDTLLPFGSMNFVRTAVLWDVTLYSLVQIYRRRKAINSQQTTRRHNLNDWSRHRHIRDKVIYMARTSTIFLSLQHTTPFYQYTSLNALQVSSTWVKSSRTRIFYVRFNTITLPSESSPLTWRYKTKFKKYDGPPRNSF